LGLLFFWDTVSQCPVVTVFR